MIKLIYISEAIRPLLEEDVLDILKGAHEKNERLNITGALIYVNKVFIQLIEGDRVSVNKLFQSISHDARHYNITIIKAEEITHRQFSHWRMKYINTEHCNDEVKALFRHDVFSLNANAYELALQSLVSDS